MFGLFIKQGKCDNKCDLILLQVKDLLVKNFTPTKMISFRQLGYVTMVHLDPRVIKFMLIVDSSSTCRSVRLRSSAIRAAYCWNTAMFDLARNVARG